MEYGLKPTFWQGTQYVFDKLKAKGVLVRGRIYFVGDRKSEERSGLQNSRSGVIYVATSTTTATRFGSFCDTDNIEDKVREVINDVFAFLTEAEIDKICN